MSLEYNNVHVATDILVLNNGWCIELLNICDVKKIIIMSMLVFVYVGYYITFNELSMSIVAQDLSWVIAEAAQ